MQSTDCYKKMSSLIFFQILFCWEPHNYYQKDRSICTEVHLLSRGRHSGTNGPADRPFNIFFARWCCLHVLLCLPNPRTSSPHLVFFLLLSSPVDTLAWTVLLLPLVTTHHSPPPHRCEPSHWSPNHLHVSRPSAKFGGSSSLLLHINPPAYYKTFFLGSVQCLPFSLDIE